MTYSDFTTEEEDEWLQDLKLGKFIIPDEDFLLKLLENIACNAYYAGQITGYEQGREDSQR